MMAHLHRTNAVAAQVAGWIAILALMAVVLFGPGAMTGKKQVAGGTAAPAIAFLNID